MGVILPLPNVNKMRRTSHQEMISLGGYDNHFLITGYETARLFHIIKCDFRIYIFIIERSDS
jgi:hypothetical protein